MSKYWFQKKDNSRSEKYNSLTGLLSNAEPSNEVDCLCAQGDDIDIDGILEQSNPEIEIHDFSRNLNIKQDNSRWFPSEIRFLNCCIDQVVIEGLKNYKLEFLNSEIKFLKISKFQIRNIFFTKVNIDSLLVQDNPSDTVWVNFAESIIKYIYLYSLGSLTIGTDKISCQVFEIKQCRSISSLNLIGSQFQGFRLLESSFSRPLINIEYCKDSLFEFAPGNPLDANDFKIKNSSSKFYFSNLIVSQKLAFDLSKSFLSSFSFEKCYFNEEINFKGDTYTSFQNIYLDNCVFKDLVLFTENNGKSLKISNTLFQKGLFIPITIDDNIPIWDFKRYHNRKREVSSIHSSVWCILKNQSMSRGDKIKSLEYKRFEMDSYSSELSRTEGRTQEKIVLWLNSVSNNHGLSWTNGVIFTILTWLLFYSIFFMAADSFHGLSTNYQWALDEKLFWTGAFKFLWIPQGVDILTDNIKNNSNGFYSTIMVFAFLLGKIMIGYGIFQTISAFRKHGQ